MSCLAAAWMPLLVLFALRAKPAMLELAVVVAGLWLTNAPAAVMGCYALAVMVAVAVYCGAAMGVDPARGGRDGAGAGAGGILPGAGGL